MDSNTVSYWKRLWRLITSENFANEELSKVFSSKDILEGLQQGISCYKPQKADDFSRLQSQNADKTKLLSIVQSLQSYMNIDCFQIWEIMKHYFCDISYGTPSKVLENTAFIDTRPSFLLPNVWKFYYTERLFLLKLLQYILQFKSDTNHKYNKEFNAVVEKIGLQQLKSSLLQQFEKVLSLAPPPKKIQNDFGNEHLRQEWTESNLREQLTILQLLLLIANEIPFTDNEFKTLFKLFRKHNFGKNQSFNDLLGDRNKESSLRIVYMEVALFMEILDASKIKNLSSWIDTMKDTVESELLRIQVNNEHSALLLTWMLLTLKSEQHAKLFESQYQHYGTTALKLKVFQSLHDMMNSCLFSDKSKCAIIVRNRIFLLLNDLCNKFDGDGTLSLQPGIMELCADLLSDEKTAMEFWKLHQKSSDNGIVSLWNTALEYFPLNFSALSILAAGLAKAGKYSVINLIAELKNLPVYTETYKPNAVSLTSAQVDVAIVSREYYPLATPSYRIEPGSRATIMERKEGTLIHFHTPYTYWTILNHEIEKSLDRKGHHQHNINATLQSVYEGTKVLKGVLEALVPDKEIPKVLVAPSEGVFDVLVRFMRTETPPLLLLVECLEVCTALVPLFANEIHLRLTNTGLLPRTLNYNLSHVDYADGASFDSATVGSYLITLEQTSGNYDFLASYIDLICAFYETTNDEKILKDIVLPGLILILREVFPNVRGWRYTKMNQRRVLTQKCAGLLALILQQPNSNNKSVELLKRTCVFSLLHTENALELLKIISAGNDKLEQIIHEETNWLSVTGTQYLSTIQRCVAVVIFALRLKTSVTEAKIMTPLERLIFSQNKQNDPLRVVPRVASYINHAFNKNLPVLCCRLLKRFAEVVHMSLYASLDMTPYQIRVMFLDRLKDNHETTELKTAILEFVTTCIGKQPGLTEAFFVIKHEKHKKDETKDVVKIEDVKKEEDESFKGVLGYMAEYLGTVKGDAKLLYSPLLARIMALFHALWKNNMQVLVKKLRENPKFWDHMTSPLFNEIQPDLRTYAQIFNVLGIELFVSRDVLEPSFKEVLEKFFDTNNKHLDKWIDYVFSFKGREEEYNVTDKVPIWLGLLTSWKDFITICCKCLPINLNIAHKSKLVGPCVSALLNELDDLRDGRLVVILSELYVIMLSNFKDDCFDNRKNSAKQIDNLLTNASVVYNNLHPRAIRAILSIGTVAISSLDYEIKANSFNAQSIIRSVTNINTMELEKLFDNINENPKTDSKPNGLPNKEEIPPIVLSFAMLEQCLDLYDEIFSGLSEWFQASRFINKLLSCLQLCLQSRRHYLTSLAALRCLTAYASGPFSKELLLSDIDQYLWMQLLPPKFDNNSTGLVWKPQEWWKVYSYSIDFISRMVMKHGQFFVGDAITFVGVHLDHLIEAVLLPKQFVNMDALNLCASTLNLTVQLVKYESRWRIENLNSLAGIMRSISACLYQCVTYLIRTRRPSDASLQTEETALHQQVVQYRVVEILHMSTLCLLYFSPDLLSLLADPGLELERWQPLVELHFGAPKLSQDDLPQLTFGTLLSAICLLTRFLNHVHHAEEGGGSRSPRSASGGGRRRACSCGSPSEAAARGGRSESLTSLSSAGATPFSPMSERLLAGALDAAATFLASQALLAIRDPNVPSRHKQLIRRELGSELTAFHDLVRRRALCAAHPRPHLVRNKLGVSPLLPSSAEINALRDAPPRNDDSDLPPPPPPKRTSNDSMREYILRKHYLDKCAQTPIKELSPVSHSTPTVDKKKDVARSSKRVSWAENTSSEETLDNSMEELEPAYSNLTDVQINIEEDYFHFMSVVFLCICQIEL